MSVFSFPAICLLSIMKRSWRPTLRVGSMVISLGSALFGIWNVLLFASYMNPDNGLSLVVLAPLCIFGLSVTFVGNCVGIALYLLVFQNLWCYAIPVIVCFFLQWQGIAWYLYRASVDSD